MIKVRNKNFVLTSKHKVIIGKVVKVLEKKFKMAKLMIIRKYFYKKYNQIKLKKFYYLAHDENNIAELNSYVKFVFTRKISKMKNCLIISKK